MKLIEAGTTSVPLSTPAVGVTLSATAGAPPRLVSLVSLTTTVAAGDPVFALENPHSFAGSEAELRKSLTSAVRWSTHG